MHRRQQQTGSSGCEKPQDFYGPAWYPLQTRYQCESKVDAALRREGFESFAPMQLETRRWSDRSKIVQSPLFPGYTFVRMEAQPPLVVKVLRLPGIVRFVTCGRELVAVPNAEMNAVRALVRSNEVCKPAPFPAVGARVRIHGGCLEGMEGVLIERCSLKEIVVTIGAIQRSLKIALGGYRVVSLTGIELAS